MENIKIFLFLAKKILQVVLLLAIALIAFMPQSLGVILAPIEQIFGPQIPSLLIFGAILVLAFILLFSSASKANDKKKPAEESSSSRRSEASSSSSRATTSGPEAGYDPDGQGGE